MWELHVGAGQSNWQGLGVRTQLDPVPSWAQNEPSGWEGHPTQSSDTGIAYPHPTVANAPGRYLDNNTGTMDLLADGWGGYDGQTPILYHPWDAAAGDYQRDGNGNLVTALRVDEVNNYGPELSFLARLRANNPGLGIAYLKFAVGGTSMDHDWSRGKPLNLVFFQALAQAKARMDAEFGPTGWRWGSFCWHQGENGASEIYYDLLTNPTMNPTGPLYTGDANNRGFVQLTREFLSDVRAATRADLPIAVVRQSDQMLHDDVILPLVGYYSAEQWRFSTECGRRKQWLIGSDPGNVRVSADGLPRRLTDAPPNRYHYHPAGYLALGERCYDALFGPPPPPPPPLAVRVNVNGVEQTGASAALRLNGVPVPLPGGPGDVLDVDVAEQP